MNNKAKDLMMMSMLAYREGQFEGSAKFYSEAMRSDDLSSFIDYVADTPDGSALHGTTEQNTMSPSLASEASSDSSDAEIRAIMAEAFMVEASADLDDEEQEIEVRASFDDEDTIEEGEDDTPKFPDCPTSIEDNVPVNLTITASAGPVGIKK